MAPPGRGLRCRPLAAIASFSLLADDVVQLAESWLAIDGDADTSDAVRAMVREGREAELRDIFGSRLEFGTAGLRGLMGPGYNRMNHVTVQQTTQGLCRYLQQQAPEKLKGNGIVIGYDGRHGSQRFASIVAAVVLSQAIPVHLFSDLVPTPFVAYAVEHLGCAGGVMVTASHNPKEYNGYKVYWGNGCQIIPPHDDGIAAAIFENLDLWNISEELHLNSPLLSDPLQQVAEAFYAGLQDTMYTEVEVPADFQVAYSPLHGVGGKWLQRAFRSFNLPEPIMVAEQAEPDADFTTVAFPNPEEGEGTWNLTFQTAERAGAPLAIANDPDADRLAVAEKDESSPSGWRAFTGNEIGILLADWSLQVFRRKNPDVPLSKVAMLSTVVSSEMMGAMAEKEGFRWEQTLTGFKWLGNVAKDLEAEGFHVVFAFEEAIGFMFGTFEKDKDGISGAAAFAQMAADLRSRGLTVAQRLKQLQERYGTFVGRQSYFVAAEPSQSKKVFDMMRKGGSYPKSLAGYKVVAVRDLGAGLDTSQPDGKAVLPWTPGDLNITLSLDNGGTLTLRASGTEPKLKYYLEVRGNDPVELAAVADAIEAAVSSELVRPEETGLSPRQL